MDNRFDELNIDLKAELKKPLPRRRPPGTRPVARRDLDWENKAGVPIKAWIPGTSEECRQKLILLLKNSLKRLEGETPARCWEPQSKTWPWTSLGSSLLIGIELCDAIADKIRAEETEQK